MKDKQIPEDELFVELDSMYQRVADIEKEEAAETLVPEKKKPKQKKKRSYRYFIIVASISFFILASIFTLTILKPTIIPQLFKMDTQPSKVVIPPPTPKRPKAPKPPVVATAPTTPAPPAVTPSPEPAKPPAVSPSPVTSPTPSVTPSPEPPKSPSQSPQVQTKPEAGKTVQEEVKKEKGISQEVPKPSKPFPQGRYYAIQIGSFREMENVHALVEALKKEGLDAYWVTSKSKKRGVLYKVFVGQFTDTNEAAQFLREKKILKNYPDSFVQEISSSKINL